MVYEKLSEVFDLVGVIDVEKYPYYYNYPRLSEYKSMFVVGLAYHSKMLPPKEGYLRASMYTYGFDYHDVIKALINTSLKGIEHEALSDNHELNERVALELTGLAYRGKNDLMINKDYGSYFFIGLVLTKERYKEVIVENNDTCGDCDLCIRACPVQALTNGFDIDRCMSANNQRKEPLPENVIENNYLLLGCDICQIVCPKNRNIKQATAKGFEVQPTAYVLINDLFDLSNKEFMYKYGHHAYTWRGKTLLLRNALTLLLRDKNPKYNDKIRETIKDNKYPDWYLTDAKKIIERLEEFEIR